ERRQSGRRARAPRPRSSRSTARHRSRPSPPAARARSADRSGSFRRLCAVQLLGTSSLKLSFNLSLTAPISGPYQEPNPDISVELGRPKTLHIVEGRTSSYTAVEV